jgi:acetylornithine/succinyldiaminopimelate/putrescine aminotransferase
MSTFIERDSECIMQTYGRLPIMVERAEGCRIFDTEGNSYLDFLAGIAVNALGHSHPKVVEAVCEQAKKYMHVSNFLYQEPQMKLAEMLQKRAGYGKAFFTNSGAESMESALKLARKWGNSRGTAHFPLWTGRNTKMEWDRFCRTAMCYRSMTAKRYAQLWMTKRALLCLSFYRAKAA